MLEHMEFVEHDLRVRQHLADGIEIRPVHVRAHGPRRPHAAAQVSSVRQQRRGCGLRAVVIAIRSLRRGRRSESTVQKRCPFPRWISSSSEVAGLPFRAGAIPRRQERPFRPARFAPAHAVSHRRMTRRHRLTVHADLLPQATRDARTFSSYSALEPLGRGRYGWEI